MFREAGSGGRSVTEAGVEEEEARGGTTATGERQDVWREKTAADGNKRGVRRSRERRRDD